MEREEFLNRVRQLNVWKRGGERAPHKPLLVLYALGRFSRGLFTPVPFAEVDRDLKCLLQDFGPTRKSYHPEYPFWRLQNDGLWVVEGARNLKTRRGHKDPKKSELLDKNVQGALSSGVQSLLRGKPNLITVAAQEILEHISHRPYTMT